VSYFLTLSVLEVDQASHPQEVLSCSAPALPPTVGSFFGIPQAPSIEWRDLELALGLPHGSPRPPLVRMELWQEAAGGSGKPSDGKPVAQAEIRLPGSGHPGEPSSASASGAPLKSEMILSGRMGWNKDVRLSFSFTIADV
jgi:hypothetical protein